MSAGHGPVVARSSDRRGGDRHHNQAVSVRFPLGLLAAVDRARGCTRSGRCVCGAPTRNAYIVGLVESGLVTAHLNRSAEVDNLPRSAEVAQLEQALPNR